MHPTHIALITFFDLLSLFWGGHQHLTGENENKANLFIHITYYLMTTTSSPFPPGLVKWKGWAFWPFPMVPQLLLFKPSAILCLCSPFFWHLLSSGMAQLAHKLYMRMTWTPLTKWGTLHCISIETYFPFQEPPHPWWLLCLRVGLLPKASPCYSVPHCLKWQHLAQGAARKLGRVNELMIFRTWSLKVETLRDLNEETQMGSMNRVYCSRIFSQTLTHTTKLKLFRI